MIPVPATTVTDGPDSAPDGDPDNRGDADPDWTALQELGWDDPPRPPTVPGDDLEWRTVDGGVVVARDPEEPSAWISIDRRGDRASDGPPGA